MFLLGKFTPRRQGKWSVYDREHQFTPSWPFRHALKDLFPVCQLYWLFYSSMKGDGVMRGTTTLLPQDWTGFYQFRSQWVNYFKSWPLYLICPVTHEWNIYMATSHKRWIKKKKFFLFHSTMFYVKINLKCLSSEKNSPNSSSNAMTISTISKLSKPRSLTKWLLVVSWKKKPSTTLKKYFALNTCTED